MRIHNLGEYIEYKFKVLEQLGIYISGQDRTRLRNAKSEVNADNIARDIICPPMADMRTI